MIGLIDCNNFFVSCERAFQPRLEGRPVIVMSSNDGCVISRSQEVKRIGIPMGVPIFKVREMVAQHGIELRSTNFALYRDMSRRVMEVIRSVAPECEVYSIDEAFFRVPEGENPYFFARRIREKVMLHTGIPTSIGLAPTKTLAKLANKRAKDTETHIFTIPSGTKAAERKRAALLRGTSVGEIWGIGRGFAERLLEAGIKDAYALSVTPDARVRSIFGIGGLRTAHELRGIPAKPLDLEGESRKSMISSRSFGQPITSARQLWNSVAFHVAGLAEDLRSEGQLARHLRIGLYVNRYKPERYLSRSDEEVLAEPTSDTGALLRAARRIFDRIRIPGTAYGKSGATVSWLGPEDMPVQERLFGDPAPRKGQGIDAVIDSLNERHGKGKVMRAELLSSSLDRSWRPRSRMMSGEYTTSWDGLPEISAVLCPSLQTEPGEYA